MNRGWPARGAVLLLSLLPALASADLDELTWLAGCWSSTDGEAGSGEVWTAPAGGSMLGLARTVRDGRTVAVEFLQIRERDDGTAELIALPSGQGETRFRLLESSSRHVLFENPDHDFPQRVSYRLDAPGHLSAAIEGEESGRTRRVSFPLRRVPCPAGATPGN